jgi:hypothetical protein
MAQDYGMPETPSPVAAVQEMLNSLGYDAGPNDGLMGPKTRGAIREFQTDAGLPVTGRIDSELLAQLQSNAAHGRSVEDEETVLRVENKLDSLGWAVGAVDGKIDDQLRIALTSALAAVLGTEAYIRAVTPRSRRAFEAFSWLGEWELAQVRALTGGGPPSNELAARHWLLANKETPELRWVRVEVLAMAKQFDEARAVADRMVDTDPAERFDKAAAVDFADWFAGGDGDLAAVEAAAADILPVDGDARLRAEVAVAAAKVRRRIAAGDDLIAAGEPLRQVRRQLGRRADGQLGRALRWRLVRTLLLVGALFAGISLLLPDLTVGI